MSTQEMIGFGWLLIIIGIWITTGFGIALIAGGAMLFMLSLVSYTVNNFSNCESKEDEENNA